MRLENKKHIIFDLDGTLIDSAPDLCRSVNCMLQTLGKERFEVEVVRQWLGNGAQVLVHRALSGSIIVDESLSDSEIQKALEIFLEHYSANVCVETFIYDGVEETLKYLFDKGYTLSIVTNKPSRFVPDILQTLKIDRYFSAILGGDSLATKKPDPAPLFEIIKKVGSKCEESVMIGDSKNDILAAKNGAIDSIAVSYGYNYGESVEIYNPDFIVSHFGDIKEIL